LYQGTALVAGIVQDEGNGDLQPQFNQLTQQLANTLGVDVGQIRDGDDLMRDRIQGPQDIEALPPARGFDPAPGKTPEIPQKRAEDKMGRIHKKDRSLTGVRFG
jgi:hypothetical protein